MIVGFGIFLTYLHFKLKRNLKITIKLALTIFLSAIVAGRIAYYIANPSEIATFFNITKGGLASVGMLLGGILGILIYTGKKNWNQFLRITDQAAYATALWIFIYRLFGCFIFGDVIGVTTESLPWGLYWAVTNVIRHPVAIYLSLNGLIIYFILKHIKQKYSGEIGLWFLFLYSTFRFFIEFLRVGVWKYYGVSSVQVVLLAFACVALFRIIQNSKIHTKKA